jgi:hypothetical protein
MVSEDGASFKPLGTENVGFDQRSEEIIRIYQFMPAKKPVRFVRFDIIGTKHNPAWHASAGGDSWVFLDEIIVH